MRYSHLPTAVGVRRRLIPDHYLAYPLTPVDRPARGLAKAARILATPPVMPDRVRRVLQWDQLKIVFVVGTRQPSGVKIQTMNVDGAVVRFVGIFCLAANIPALFLATRACVVLVKSR